MSDRRDPLAILDELRAVETAQAQLTARRMALYHELCSATEQPIDGDRLLSKAEAASRLGMSPSWLERAENGRPFRVLVGKSVRYSAAKIDRYLRRRAVASTMAHPRRTGAR